MGRRTEEKTYQRKQKDGIKENKRDRNDNLKIDHKSKDRKKYSFFQTQKKVWKESSYKEIKNFSNEEIGISFQRLLGKDRDSERRV